MKMIKVLPILLTAALLATGCSSKKVSYDVKKYKNEVTHAEFYEAYTKAMDETVKIPSEPDQNMFDYTAKGSSRDIYKVTTKIEGKVHNEGNIQEDETLEVQYDADNVMGHVKGEAEMDYKVKMNYGESDGEAIQKTQTDFYGKETKIDDSNYKLDIVNASAKLAYSRMNSTPSFASNLFNKAATKLGYNYLPVFDEATYNAFPEEEKANFKFYNDKNVLTVAYATEGNDETSNYKVEYKNSIVAQMSFKENKFSYVIVVENDENYEYLANVDQFVVGEIEETHSATSYKMTLDLSPVELEYDYSNFEESTYSYSVNSMFPSLGL